MFARLFSAVCLALPAVAQQAPPQPSFAFLEKYIPTEVQRGYNDPETLARPEAVRQQS